MFLEKYKLDGKIALITGGTRGIGLSIAHAFGEAGAKLVLTSRNNNNDVLDSLKKANYDVSLFEADFHDKSIPQKTIDYTLEKHGRVDIVVNNAGVAKHGKMEEYNDDLLDGIMNINVDAVFRMCRSAIPPMKKQGEGVILNIGSISGLVSNIPQPQVAYNASKAAVHMMTKSLASDYADQNIRVTSSLPNGSGKKIKILVLSNEADIKEAIDAGADYAGNDDFLKKLESGWSDIDVIVAHPSIMPKLGKLGKILGPKGLMPNPKSGTVSSDVVASVKDIKSGRIELRVDKNGIVHAPIGKKSFSEIQLVENFNSVLNPNKL